MLNDLYWNVVLKYRRYIVYSTGSMILEKRDFFNSVMWKYNRFSIKNCINHLWFSVSERGSSSSIVIELFLKQGTDRIYLQRFIGLGSLCQIRYPLILIIKTDKKDCHRLLLTQQNIPCILISIVDFSKDLATAVYKIYVHAFSYSLVRHIICFHIAILMNKFGILIYTMVLFIVIIVILNLK